MNTITATERNANKTAQKSKFINFLKKVLVYTCVTVGVILLLAVLYKILEIIFTAALLFIAWLHPRRWWR